MNAKLTVTRHDTIEAILTASSRRDKGVPIRRSFVQRGSQGAPESGVLAELLYAHDERALDLYLLFRVASSSAPWDVTRDARVWARALGLPTPRDDGSATVSKIWSRLDRKYHLVARERRGRLAKIVALNENGTGSPYSYPTGGELERYFKVPFAYWMAEERWYEALSFPAKAVLMIALSLQSPFVLPTTKIRDWYGISTESGERGLRELRHRGVLHRRLTTKRAPLAPLAETQEYRYTLKPPFARSARGRHLAVVKVAS